METANGIVVNFWQQSSDEAMAVLAAAQLPVSGSPDLRFTEVQLQLVRAIQLVMQEKNWNQRDIASAVGCSESYIKNSWRECEHDD